jgi:hypothetical protein
MILLCKTQSLTRMKAYRPISLMHSFRKLFAKCLARRLVPKLKLIVEPNQSAFIKERSIHDNFWSVQLACKWLHCKKFIAVLLKVDIAKAFDSVAWPFLLEVLQFIGFPRRWTEWISILLSTASTKVLPNGRARRRIVHARGLRQGDPIAHAVCYRHGSAKLSHQGGRSPCCSHATARNYNCAPPLALCR